MEKLRTFIKDLAAEWTAKAPARQAAALAYYSMFSLAPIIFVALSVSEFLFSSVDLTSEILTQIEATFGADVANFIQSLVAGIGSPENGIASNGTSSVITLVSIGALLYAASGLFYHLQYSLDVIWGRPWEEEGGIFLVVRGRLIAFFLVISLGLVLVLIEVVSVALVIIRRFFQIERLVPIVDTVIILSIEALVLILIYKFLPRAKVAWRDVYLASVLTVILINIARWGVSLYLSFSDIGSAFQAAGSLAVILIAIYYIAQIFLFGAMFSRVYAHHFGSRKSQPLIDEEPERLSTNAGNADSQSSP